MSYLSQPEKQQQYTTTHNNTQDGPETAGAKLVNKRFSKRCFCTVFLITLIFLVIIGLLVILPLTQYIVTNLKNNKPNLKNNKHKDKIGPVKSSKPLVLVDPATSDDVKSYEATSGEIYELSFSDEFETEGRTFFPGDDPVWEAVDLWYEGTGDLEYYKPEQVTTQDGNMVITIDKKSVGQLKYTSGMVQSWNKVCFQGGYMEVKVSLPGSAHISGLWPGAWTLGNLARAGYKSTTDGVWPYSYDTCDEGVAKNQSLTGISDLPGQKLNKCVCKGEDHPNPGKGRGAPEIDLIESTAQPGVGSHVSQSLQVAPFDYQLQVDPKGLEVAGGQTQINTYKGSKLQQAVSALTNLKSSIFNGNEFETFGFEFEPGEDGHITWFVGGKKTFTIKASALKENLKSKVANRLIPEEPMYMIFNLAMSESFSKIDYSKLNFPSYFLIDYVRVYQHPDRKKMSCDPESHPTKEYINKHKEAYYNKNWTTWEKAGYSFPKYSLNSKC